MQKKKRRRGKNGIKQVSQFSYNYREFLTLFPCCRESHQLNLLDQLWKAEKPKFLLGKEVPENFNTITYGQLDDLSRSKDCEDPVARCLEVIMGFSTTQILSLDVWDVFGFASFCLKELDRINKLFNSIKQNHTAEELAAGIEDLSFGTFGVVDWYARRMGITNQDEVYSIAWIRIYTCMKNDNLQNQYERRLRDQYIKTQKMKGGKRR